jgi:methyl-accepting chemotaxis protein
MRFRAKIVLGIGLIEAILLTVLVVSALGWLRSSNESQLMHRAALVEGFLDAAARDPIISYDIAGLISLSDDLVNMDEVAYIRFLDDRGRVLARKGPPALLDKPFHGDTSLAMVDDAILDREINIRAGGRIQGRVQYGLNTGTLAAFLNQTRAWALAIILIELVLVVLLSLGLAGWLTRRLTDLRLANDEVAAGNLAHTLREAGGDELADTARAFNTMTARLREARARNEAALKAIQDLASYQHAILDASDSAIIVTDPTGLITHFNPAAERCLAIRDRKSVV